MVRSSLLRVSKWHLMARVILVGVLRSRLRDLPFKCNLSIKLQLLLPLLLLLLSLHPEVDLYASGSRSADSSDYEDQVDDAERLHARREQMEKLISGLHGAHSLDAFCCTHEIPPSAVLDTTHMFVPCKAASNR